MSSRAWLEQREGWRARWAASHGRDPLCQVCGAPWALRRSDVHHRSYARLGSERDADLVPLCRPCHRRLHEVLESDPRSLRLGREQATAVIIARLRAKRRGTMAELDRFPRDRQHRGPVDNLREIIGTSIDDDLVDVPGPTRWPGLPAADAPGAWEALRGWVEELCARFPHLDHHVCLGAGGGTTRMSGPCVRRARQRVSVLHELDAGEPCVGLLQSPPSGQ